MIKAIYNSTYLAPGVRTYIVKKSEYNNIILSLPLVDFERKYNDIYEGFVVTIINASQNQVLIESGAGYNIKGVDDYFILYPKQSITFHNLKSTWYAISK